MEVDQDNLRTGIAVGCRAFRELCSNYLFIQAYTVSYRDALDRLRVRLNIILLH